MFTSSASSFETPLTRLLRMRGDIGIDSYLTAPGAKVLQASTVPCW